jgi:hypothetical protein
LFSVVSMHKLFSETAESLQQLRRLRDVGSSPTGRS